jgi:RimJ/RimL family protein N-acetyltransferase
MSVSAWIVRPLTAEDAEQRRALRLESLRDFPTSYGSTYEQWASRPLETFQQLPPPDDGLFVGGFDGAQMIGLAGVLRFEAPIARHWAHIVGMYVKPVYWGQGVAEAIVLRLLEFARGRFEFVELSATAGNDRAQRFYERMGFREFGRRPRSMRHAGRDYDEILMFRAC